LTGGLTASSAVLATEHQVLQFSSLKSENALPFCQGLTGYLGKYLGSGVQLVEAPWQEAEQMLYAGQAELGAVCGLQYVLANDSGVLPGLQLLAAPVMCAPRYADQPVYFSEVIVRQDAAAHSLADLRGATWAYNEPTSHSGFCIMHYTLAVRGEDAGFFGRELGSGSHLRSLELLLSGDIDTTAVDSTVLEQELRSRPELAQRIRVVETLGPSPMPPVVASRALPITLRERVRAALLSMHLDAQGATILEAAAVRRFVGVADSDYDPIRHMAGVARVIDVS
jgi:phosphonate transport system substrate-binding protein